MARSSPESFENNTTNSDSKDFKIEIDPQLGGKIQEGLQGGIDAIQSIFSSVVRSMKDAIGPEILQNLQAGQWLSQVASSLEEVLAAWNAGQSTPLGKAGELECFLERLDTELAGSKLASQSSSLRTRLEDALRAVASDTQDVNAISNAIGYWNAAAKSAIPIQMKTEN